MKKLVLAFVILLAGCVITDSLLETKADNENCIDVRSFKVLQAVYHSMGLAFECSTPDCSDFYYNNNVDFIIGDKIGEDLYDGMIYKVPNDKCAVRNGVYRYENKEGLMKTVSNIVFEYKNDCKSEKECQNRAYEAKENLYFLCLMHFELENIKQDEQYCTCYADSYTDNDGDAKAIKQDCGKLPKFLPSK